MNILKTGSKYFSNLALPALNWYKLAAFIILFGAWTGFVHMRATNKCEIAHEQQKTEQAETKTQEVIAHVAQRLPVVQEKEIKAAVLYTNNQALRKQIKESIYENKYRNVGSCDLSDVEFERMQQLIEQSKTATH